MAKYMVQIVVTGLQIVGRSFARAVRTELRASQTAAQARKNQTPGGDSKRAAADALTGMSVSEAKQVLNIDGIDNFEKLQRNYDHLFNVNEKSNGGSLYLQSKVVRAKERIDQEIRDQMELAQKKQQKQQKQQKHKEQS